MSVSAPIRYPRFMATLCLTAVIFCLYSISLGHNFLFDEDNIILLNPILRSPAYIWQILSGGFFQPPIGTEAMWHSYYRPLTLLSFAVDFWIWKVNPLGYNLTNTFLHMGIAFLFYRLLARIVKSELAAFLAALLYISHTLHTESVTYIASRGDLFGALATLAALHFYSRGRWGATALIYALSLFFKENCILIPVYLILWDIAFIRTPLKKLPARLLPFAGVLAFYFLYRKFLSGVPFGPGVVEWREATLRFLSMGPPFLSYLKALVAPEPFKFCESIDFATRFQDPVVAQTLFVMALALTGWALTWRYRGAAFFGMSFFLASFTPSLQIVHFNPEWAEHYFLLPAMGLSIALAALFHKILQTSRRWKMAFFGLVFTPFWIFISLRTYQRNSFYKSTARYYTALAQSPSPYAYYGYINLGIMAVMRGSWDEAFVPLKTAWHIYPEAESNNYNLGLYYYHKGKYEDAARHFTKAYETPIGVHQPADLIALAQTLMKLERYDEAIGHLREVQKKSPKLFLVYKNLIRAYEYSGRPDQALEWANRGLELFDGKKEHPIEHAALLSETILLAYVNEWDELADEKIDVTLREHASRPWYGDAAKLMKGTITLAEYEKLMHTQYMHNEKDAHYVILMAHVLNHRWREASEFLKDHKEMIEKEADDVLISNKIIQRAERSIAAGLAV
ncbi:MAG: tetratricopeptide repeat protein [Candidatus Omnitrophica bacterium]|nr:tetratricopeptide repeat protein [Candidatus Omnitrophota bacterium]